MEFNVRKLTVMWIDAKVRVPRPNVWTRVLTNMIGKLQKKTNMLMTHNMERTHKCSRGIWKANRINEVVRCE